MRIKICIKVGINARIKTGLPNPALIKPINADFETIPKRIKINTETGIAHPNYE